MSYVETFLEKTYTLWLRKACLTVSQLLNVYSFANISLTENKIWTSFFQKGN